MLALKKCRSGISRLKPWTRGQSLHRFRLVFSFIPYVLECIVFSESPAWLRTVSPCCAYAIFVSIVTAAYAAGLVTLRVFPRHISAWKTTSA